MTQGQRVPSPVSVDKDENGRVTSVPFFLKRLRNQYPSRGTGTEHLLFNCTISVRYCFGAIFCDFFFYKE